MSPISVFVLVIFFLVVGPLAATVIRGFALSLVVRRSHLGEFDQGPAAPGRLSTSAFVFPNAPRPGVRVGELATPHGASHRETATNLSWSAR